MAKLPTACPSCSSALEVQCLVCPSCDSRLEGRFEIPALLSLPPDDLTFVVQFVRSSGSLKEMAKLRGQSYPTIRNRLNDIISRLQPISPTADLRRHEILDAIAKGELTVAEATRQLEAIKP